MADSKMEKAARGMSKERKPARRREARQFDLEALNTHGLLAAIQAILSQGGAIRLGLTRDGGALAVGIYGDGDPYTDYLRPDDDVAEYMDDLAEHWARGSAEGGAGSAR